MHADGTEAALVERLRVDGDLAISLVAEQEGVLVGHIGFSPITIDGADHRWFELAPLSVALEQRRAGIGAALVEAGLAMLRLLGARGVGVVGDPQYYGRFGFVAAAGLAPAGPEAEWFRALTLVPPAPTGVVRYAAAFG